MRWWSATSLGTGNVAALGDAAMQIKGGFLVRGEGDFVALEFLDARCDCNACGRRGECYASGTIRLARSEARKLAEMLLKASEEENREEGALCPEIYLAGADVALRVAVESGIRPLNWLLSAGRYWSGGKFKQSEDFKMARSLGGLLFLDSGAQQFFSKFKGGGYPYTPAQYLDFALNVVGADLIATLDLPLDILAPRGLPVAEGIRKTVEYGVEVAALAEKLGAPD